MEAEREVGLMVAGKGKGGVLQGRGENGGRRKKEDEKREVVQGRWGRRRERGDAAGIEIGRKKK